MQPVQMNQNGKLSRAAGALALVAGLLFSTAAMSQTPVAGNCVSNRKGVTIPEMEPTALNEMLKPVGGVKGLMAEWETSGGTVKFQISKGKIVAYYSFFLSSDWVRIIRFCKVGEKTLSMTTVSEGEEDTWYIRGVSWNHLKMGKSTSDMKDFYR